MNHHPCTWAGPDAARTAHGAPSQFEVTAENYDEHGERHHFKYTVCAEHLMPTIVWCYSNSYQRASDVRVLPIYMSWPKDWAEQYLATKTPENVQ